MGFEFKRLNSFMSYKCAKFVLSCTESNLFPGKQTYIMIFGRSEGKRKNKRQVNKIEIMPVKKGALCRTRWNPQK